MGPREDSQKRHDEKKKTQRNQKRLSLKTNTNKFQRMNEQMNVLNKKKMSE